MPAKATHDPDRGIKMAEMTKAFLTSESQAWATPKSVIWGLKPEFNFTLDVCASATSTKAPKYYDEAEDAFKQNWARDAAGGDAWCNPHYAEYLGHSVGDWAQEAWRFRKELNSVLLLPINKQDQDWYHDLVLPYGEYRPVRGRIPFVDPITGKPPVVLDEVTGKKKSSGNSQGSMLIIFGPNYAPRAPKTFDFKEIRRRYNERGGE